MKRMLFTLAGLILVCNPALADDLKRISLDDASKLGTTIETDRGVKTEGKGSIRITTKHPTTICIGEITGLDVENAKLTYKANVKSDLNGQAFLEMWAYVGNGRYFSKGMNDPIKGRSDWKLIQTPFIFQKGQNPKSVTLNLVINGIGTVWIDDVVLSKASLN
jgi:hypothetical protein